jgi:hypothetical protein
MEVKFSTAAPAVAASSRFTVPRTVPTDDGGTVGVGTDKRGEGFLVYAHGRQSQGVPIHAVATAVGVGVITPAQIVDVIASAGQLPKLAAAVEKASK